MPCWLLLPESVQSDDGMPSWRILWSGIAGADPLSVWHVLESAPADFGLSVRSVHRVQLRLARNSAVHFDLEPRLPAVLERAHVRHVHWSGRLRVGLQQRIRWSRVRPLSAGLLVRKRNRQPVPAVQHVARRVGVPERMQLQSGILQPGHHPGHQPVCPMPYRFDVPWRRGDNGDGYVDATGQRACSDRSGAAAAACVGQPGVAVRLDSHQLGQHQGGAPGSDHDGVHAPGLPRFVLRLVRRIEHLHSSGGCWDKSERRKIRLQRQLREG